MYEIIRAVDSPSPNEAANKLKPSGNASKNRKSPEISDRIDNPKPIQQQPLSDNPSQNTQNTRSKKSVVQETLEGLYNKYVSNSGPTNLDTEVEYQSKFSISDRVVLQSVNGKTISGTVRWVGPMRARGKVTIPVVIGIETVSWY